MLLSLNRSLCCGYSKEPSRRDGSFEYLNISIWLIDKKISSNVVIKIYSWTFIGLYNWTDNFFLLIERVGGDNQRHREEEKGECNLNVNACLPLLNHTKYLTTLCLGLTLFSMFFISQVSRRQKLHSSAHNYEWNLERMSNSSQSTLSVGRVLYKDLLEEVILHIAPLCSLQGSHKLWKSWKTWKIPKKSSMHGKTMEFEKTWIIIEK